MGGREEYFSWRCFLLVFSVVKTQMLGRTNEHPHSANTNTDTRPHWLVRETRVNSNERTELSSNSSVCWSSVCSVITNCSFGSRVSRLVSDSRRRPSRCWLHVCTTHTHTHTHTRTHARTHARKQASTHARTHTHTRTHTHARMHARTHAHTQHTHTHAHTHLFRKDFIPKQQT